MQEQAAESAQTRRAKEKPMQTEAARPRRTDSQLNPKAMALQTQMPTAKPTRAAFATQRPTQHT